MLTAVTMVPRSHRSDAVTREVFCEGRPKLTRGEVEMRKCLTSNTNEILLKSYSCAWQKEILVQGRLYITPHYLCFYSSILGFETKTAIKVRDVTSIKKEKTAHLFPNAIVISTAGKRYGFSTFANRNKSYEVLQIVWQNETSEMQPVSGELLAARIRLLKGKSNSVECSPVSSPHHPSRRPMWQLSLQSASKSSGHTDSDSSGTSSPVLLSRTLTPPIPTPGTKLTPSHPHSDSKLVGGAPRVVVTTFENTGGVARSQTTEVYPDSNSSHDSLFVDATDTIDLGNSNSNPDGAGVSNLNSDSIDSSESVVPEDMASSNSTDSETTELRTGRKHLSFNRKLDSSLSEPHTVGRPHQQVGGSAHVEESEEDSGIMFGTGEGEGEGEREREGLDDESGLVRGSCAGEGEVRGQVRAVPSVIREILGRVHVHPTRMGLWRLQRALYEWCTPSNFINLLIVISIFLLLISTASMLCRLSHVNPAFQPLVAWQPWCWLCSDCQQSSAKPHPLGGAYERDSSVVWTLESFEELVSRHTSSEPSQAFDAGDMVSEK